MCSRQQLHIPFLFPDRANLPPCDFPSKNSAAIDFDRAERDHLAPTPPVGTVTRASAVPARPRCPGAPVLLLNLPAVSRHVDADRVPSFPCPVADLAHVALVSLEDVDDPGRGRA